MAILVGLSFFFLLVAENMPATSEAVPLVGMYYTVTMIEVSCAFFMTCWVLRFHHHNPTDGEVPRWVKVGLSWLTCSSLSSWIIVILIYRHRYRCRRFHCHCHCHLNDNCHFHRHCHFNRQYHSHRLYNWHCPCHYHFYVFKSLSFSCLHRHRRDHVLSLSSLLSSSRLSWYLSSALSLPSVITV